MARDYNGNNRQNENENYNDVTNRIKSLNQLSDLSIKEIIIKMIFYKNIIVYKMLQLEN